MLRWVPFFFLMALVFGAINVHVYRRATRTFEVGRGVRRGIAALVFGSLAGTFLGRGAAFLSGVDLGPFILVCSVVQLIVVLGFVLLLPLDVVRLARRAWARATTKHVERPPQAAPAPPEPTRRKFLEQAAVGSSFLVASSSSLYGTLRGRHDYQLEEVPVRVPGLPPTLDGFSIVQLSDVHIGAHVGAPELAAAWDIVRRAKPDMIVLTGDLLDSDARLAGVLGRFTSRLRELAPRGVVAISGNHDFYAGIDPTCRALEAAGATVLRNQGMLVGDAGGSFALLGVDDVMGPRFGASPGADLNRAVQSLPESRDLPSVLLCHNPNYFEEAAGQVALQLSGHTHGGQIRLGVSPADLFLWHGWVRGRYEHQGSQLYVNRGFGTVGPPARIGAPPEVTRIVLHS